MLIILGGLPGTGKTTIAGEMSRRMGAVHIRIDTIENALWDTGKVVQSMADTGYRVAYAVSEDNLKLGRVVIADSVNPIAVTRDAWRTVANRAGVDAVEVEIVCSDRAEHRHRVETRAPDIPGSTLPTWEEVLARGYEPWASASLVIDTAGIDIGVAVSGLLSRLPPEITQTRAL